jgi:hypothetical protein
MANFGVLLAHAYCLTGTVVGLEQERPGVMAQLTLLSNNGESQVQQLPLDGKFQFENVLPGTYHAQVITASLGSGTPSVKMLNIRTPIDVNGGDLLGFELQLDPGGDVSGRLRLDGDGKMNWQELSVGLMPVGENSQQLIGMFAASAHAQVQEDGSFVLKDKPGGTFQLVVYANSEKWRDFYTKSVLSGGREVADSGFDVNGGMLLDVVVSPNAPQLKERCSMPMESRLPRPTW